MKVYVKILIILLVITSSMIYSQTPSWKIVSQMPFPVSDGQAVVKDSMIYILGGFSDSLGIPINLIQEYNPKANRWRVFGHMRLSRSAFLAAQFKDSVIICGGSVRGPSPSNYFSMEMWNLKSDPYFFRFNENFNRIFLSGEVIGEKLYLIGGSKNNPSIMPNHLAYISEYDVKNDSVTFIFDSVYTNIQLPIHQAVASIRNDIFIFGGVAFGVTPKIFRFNAFTKHFHQISIPLNLARAGAAAINFDDDKIIIIGGYNESIRAMTSTEIFTAAPGNITIRFGPSLNFPRRNPIAVRFKNSVYVFGGEDLSRRDVPFVEHLDLMTNVEETHLSPTEFTLMQNYPNPFNPSTTISFKITQKLNILIEIFNLLGEKVKTLCNEEFQAGVHELEWLGKDDLNNPLSAGVYLYKLSAKQFTASKKMVLLK